MLNLAKPITRQDAPGSFEIGGWYLGQGREEGIAARRVARRAQGVQIHILVLVYTHTVVSVDL
jgi:hypothetical protein